MWYNICVTILKFNQGFQSPSFGGTDWILEELSVLIGIELETWGHWGLVQPQEECCAEPTEAHESESEVTQSCLTLWDPLDCSLPGSSVCGIFQARVLEWVATSFSRGSSWPRDRILVGRIASTWPLPNTTTLNLKPCLKAGACPVRYYQNREEGL